MAAKQFKTVKALLQATLDLFEKKPELWGQGSLGGKPSTLTCDNVSGAAACYCVVTGIHHVHNGGTGKALAAYDNPDPDPLAGRAVIHFAIANDIGVKYRRTQKVTQWNDAPERTRDEVLAAFRKAIATKFNQKAM